MLRTEKGITLVALIITIIILVILASITIVTITQTDMINRSVNAGNAYLNGAEIENNVLDKVNSILSSYDADIKTKIPSANP